MTPTRRQEIERVAYGNTVAEGMVRELLAEVDRLKALREEYRAMADGLAKEVNRLTASRDALTDAYSGAKRDRDTAMNQLNIIEQVCQDAGIATDSLTWVGMVGKLTAERDQYRAVADDQTEISKILAAKVTELGAGALR